MKNSLRVVCILFFLVATSYALTPANPGDLNADNAVTVADVYIVSGCLGQNAVTCQGGKADPNNDGAVNIFDFIHVSQNWGRTYGGQDTTPPDPTITSPTMNQIIASGTSQWTFTVTTNEPATCKHHGSDATYAAMSNTFSGAGTTSHTSVLTLQDGTTKTRYVRCEDMQPTPNTMQASEFVTYSVGNAPGATCGNGIIESGEQCDGTNLNGATCVSRGFTGGTLSCHATTCQYVTNACTNPPPSGNHPNEPAGFTLITNRAFDAKPGTSGVAGVEDGWYDRGDGSSVVPFDATTINPANGDNGPSPISSPNIQAARFPAGQRNGSGPVQFGKDWSGLDEVYLHMHWMIDKNAFGQSKFGYMKLANNYAVYLAAPQGNPTFEFRTANSMRFNIQAGGSFADGTQGQSGTGSFAMGQWHDLEWYLKVNSVTGGTPNHDGVIKLWIDGQLVINRNDALFRGTAQVPNTAQWTGFRFNPTYDHNYDTCLSGGTGCLNIDNQRTWYEWIDNVYISGRP